MALSHSKLRELRGSAANIAQREHSSTDSAQLPAAGVTFDFDEGPLRRMWLRDSGDSVAGIADSRLNEPDKLRIAKPVCCAKPSLERRRITWSETMSELQVHEASQKASGVNP
jgi:hypothetical protein